MSKNLSPSERLALIKAVNSLMQADFDSLLFALDVPYGVIPSDISAQGNRASALLQWVQSPAGCGLAEFLVVLDEVAPGAFNIVPRTLKPQEDRSHREQLPSEATENTNILEPESVAKRRVEQALKISREHLARVSREDRGRSMNLMVKLVPILGLIITIVSLLLQSGFFIYGFGILLVGLVFVVVIRVKPISAAEQAKAEAYLNEIERLLLSNRVVEAASEMEAYTPPRHR